VPRTPVIATVDQAKDVPLSLFVGRDFVADEEKAFESSTTARFAVFHGGHLEALAEPEGVMPFAHAYLGEKGGYLFVLDRNVGGVELPAREFEASLRHDGLGAVLAERVKRGESSAPGRERVTRHMKAFVEVGNHIDESFDFVAGQKLELSPGDNPVDVKPGGVLRFLLEYEGAPVDGARIEALSRVGGDVRSSVYATNAHGIVNVPIDRRGLWLVQTVHMIRCEGCADADWQTTSASYVFASTAPDGSTVAIAPSKAAHSGSGRLSAAILAGLLIGGSAIFSEWRRRRRVGSSSQ